MITMGCDVGSLFTKAVILDGDELAASRVISTTGDMAEHIDGFIKSLIAQARMRREDIKAFGATGSGAQLCVGADFIEDVIACAGAAAAYFVPIVEYSVDIGGQSITALAFNEDGDVVNFIRNDKCAAGSGRFLEVMSRKLLVDIADIDKHVPQAKRAASISNQCVVFAESEVITHVNDGESPPEIILGVSNAVANMVAAQTRKLGLEGIYTLTGGVALLQSVVGLIGERLAGRYEPFPHNPQLAAAMGAALLADA